MTEEKYEKAKEIRDYITKLKSLLADVEASDKAMLRNPSYGISPTIELPQQYFESVRAKYVMDLQNKIKRLEQDFNEL